MTNKLHNAYIRNAIFFAVLLLNLALLGLYTVFGTLALAIGLITTLAILAVITTVEILLKIKEFSKQHQALLQANALAFTCFTLAKVAVITTSIMAIIYLVTSSSLLALILPYAAPVIFLLASIQYLVNLIQLQKKLGACIHKEAITDLIKHNKLAMVFNVTMLGIATLSTVAMIAPNILGSINIAGLLIKGALFIPYIFVPVAILGIAAMLTLHIYRARTTAVTSYQPLKHRLPIAPSAPTIAEESQPAPQPRSEEIKLNC